tara:strand:- start:83 stop:451 length:369 start_codon:yes stop_codon:yes gene_type:complete
LKVHVTVLTLPLSSTSLSSQELPQQGQITGGKGSIAQNGAAMSITQTSPSLDIDWNSFYIGAENPVTFGQPSGKASHSGVTTNDNRLFLEAWVLRVRTGSLWHDFPDHFGNWNSQFHQRDMR